MGCGGAKVFVDHTEQEAELDQLILEGPHRLTPFTLLKIRHRKGEKGEQRQDWRRSMAGTTIEVEPARMDNFCVFNKMPMF